MKKRVRLIPLLLSALFLAGCSAAEGAPQLLEPVDVQADMAKAYVGEFYKTTVYQGAVVPYVEELSFPVDGYLKEIPVYAGQEVKKGDVLLELDQTAAEEQAEQLRSDLEFTEQDNAYADQLAEMEIDILELELRQLWAAGAGYTETALKELEIEEKKAQLRQTQELREPELEARRQQLETLEASLKEGTLRAPFDGRVVFCSMKEGDAVSPYKPVLYLADDTRLSLSSEYVADLLLNSANRLYALVGGKSYEITPRPVDQSEYISKALSGVELKTYYDITGPREDLSLLEAGQYAAVCLVNNLIPDALLVPSGTIYRESGSQYVYVDNNGQRERRAVKTGASNDAMTQILEGLEEGEVVYVKE